MQTTPPQIDEHVLNLATRLKVPPNPEYIPVLPAPGALPLDCFPVVERCVQKQGGQAVLGWALWLWPGFIIEAEFHAVWRLPSGRMIDPTPKDGGEEEILFLADPSATYTGKRVDNVRVPILRDPDLLRWIALEEEINREIPADFLGVVHPGARLGRLKAESLALMARMMARYPAILGSD